MVMIDRNLQPIICGKGYFIYSLDEWKGKINVINKFFNVNAN